YYMKDERTPIRSLRTAGEKLAALAQDLDLAFFEYWPSDYAGHRQDKSGALELLENFDRMLEGLLASWQDEEGLILITSDHGNMEDISTRRHTANLVPGLVIGSPALRQTFCQGLTTLADVTPAILRFYPSK
ncbi:MAG TPA: alkaline phosphatase family protein, partial [Anaerolineales bacterium]|nr:alkaline phosphatase family protein [Anaerolineales bacterium]